MAKYVLLPRLTVFDNEFNLYEGIEDLLIDLNEKGHKIIVVSHDTSSIKTMKATLKEIFDFKILCTYRRTIQDHVNEENANQFVIVGSSNEDLHLAAIKKILIINPGWSIKQDEKPVRYGITLNHPNQLYEAIQIIDNQNKWYFKLKIDQDTTVLALTSANTLNYDVTHSEREILKGFEKLLKSGNRRYFNTLYFHLISGVMKSSELRKVDIWGTFPSSSGKPNTELEELKERCRYLTGRKMKEPLFIRHTPVDKSRNTPFDTRLRIGCKKHFDSIILNPYYASRIRGKIVCVIDDYITNGTSFEAARNLLISAGAKKIILLALGRYKRGAHGIYQHEVYNISGNITNVGYKYNLIKKENLLGEYDRGAREEIIRIYNILNK